MPRPRKDQPKTWPFKEGDQVIFTPQIKRFGLFLDAQPAKIRKLYPSGYASIELRCGIRKHVLTKSLGPMQ